MSHYKERLFPKTGLTKILSNIKKHLGGKVEDDIKYRIVVNAKDHAWTEASI